MSRPSVSVVMPFAGDRAAGARALAALCSLRLAAGDERILADNSGVVTDRVPGVSVVSATGERSPARARNAGAATAGATWLLFLDADCVPVPDLLDRYFARPVGAQVGALAGAVRAAPGHTAAERYGVARNFLDQRAHLAHPYRPRAVAANLLVRRDVFAALGGFLEGLRAAEDTDFAWRLHGAGWRIELREEAVVEHRYRTTVGELRRQWRGYAAGRAWLARRYPGFTPEPAIVRGLRRAASLRPSPRRSDGGVGGPGSAGAAVGSPPASAGAGGATWAPSPSPGAPGRRDQILFRCLDVVLALEELVGFTLSNRPPGADAVVRAPTVVVADRFPAQGDPAAGEARRLGPVAVEAASRPDALDLAAAQVLHVAYREDDGLAARALATLRFLAGHPTRCLADSRARVAHSGPPLHVLAPSAARVAAANPERVVALLPSLDPLAQRLRRLAG